MYILTSRNRIINFNNANQISIAKAENGSGTYELLVWFGNEDIVLARYATRERAVKEVKYIAGALDSGCRLYDLQNSHQEETKNAKSCLDF